MVSARRIPDNLPSNDNGFELFVTFTDSFDDCTLNIRLLVKTHGLGCFVSNESYRRYTYHFGTSWASVSQILDVTSFEFYIVISDEDCSNTEVWIRRVAVWADFSRFSYQILINDYQLSITAHYGNPVSGHPFENRTADIVRSAASTGTLDVWLYWIGYII